MRNEMLQSSIIFDAAMSARSIDENGFLHVAASHITKATVNPYYGREIPGWREAGLEPDKVYYGFRAPEELKKSVSTWTGLPLHIEHHIDSAEEPAKLTRVGAIGAAFWNAPYVDASLTVWDQNAIEAIEDGSFRELSCAYRYEPDFTPGTHEGVAYDFVMRNIRGNHVALVEEGRAGPDVVVADAAMDWAYADRWITVNPNGPDKKGRPVLIDESGTVKAGMGGKFNGRNIDDIPRGKNPHPVTEEKYQAWQQRNQSKTQGTLEPRNPINEAGQPKRQQENRAKGQPKTTTQTKKSQGSVSYNENGQPIPPKRPDYVPDGYWNGKFYSGNRIYVDNRVVNLSDDQVKELKQWQADYAEYKKARQADTQAAPKSYLNVRYEDRQKAKEAGAKWDSDAKKWYWDNRNGDLPESLKQWSGEAVKTNGPSSGTNTYAPSSGSAKNLSEYDRNDLEREARKWDQLYNEGGEGFNPYRAEIERRRFTRPNEPMTVSEVKRFWNRGGMDASPKYAEDFDNPAYYPDMQTLHRSSHKNITSYNFLKGGIMGKLKRWFRGAFDDDPGIEKKEVELAQAIIDLHKTDPVTGEIVDVTEDEDKAEEIRELVDELSAKLDPEDVKKLTDALTDLAYSKATGDEDPDKKDSVVTIDEELREAMDKCGLDADDPDDSRAFAEGVKYGEELERNPEERGKLDREHESEGMKRAMDSCGLDAENPMEARAFAEGVKYGEKKEKTEPGKLAREHEREGELRALGKDEDKSAAITRILDDVPGLTPEQRKKLFDALQDLAYSPATGDEGMDEPETAQDRALRRRASRSFVAMDAARIKASAIAEAQEHMRGLSRAVRDVRGLVGDLDPLSFDCASDVYGYALKQSGVNPQAYPRQAWRGMVDVMRAKNTAVFPGGMARDAATSKMTGKFTGLNNITIAD